MSNDVSQQRTLFPWSANDTVSLVWQKHTRNESQQNSNTKQPFFRAHLLQNRNYLQISAASRGPCHSLGCHTPKTDHDSCASLLKGDLVLGFYMVLHCCPCTQFRNNRFRDSDHKGPTGLTSIRIIRHVRQKSFTLVWSFQSDQALHCSQTFGFLREGVGPNIECWGTLVSIKSISKFIPPACRSHQGGRPSPVDDISP